MTRPTRTRRAAALLAVTAVLLAACNSAPDVNRDVSTENASQEPIDTSDLNVPISIDGLDVLDPGWDLPPQFADGIYLSAAEQDDVLAFSALSINGEVLWSTERPASFTDFVLTASSDGTAVAVLLDEGESTDLSARAYDLRSGDSLWGPVDVPGSFAGPGLIFTGEERFTIDPDDGNIVAGPYIAEHAGTLLSVEGRTLSATDSSGSVLWEVGADEQDAEWIGTAGAYVLLKQNDKPGRVIDAATGHTIADSITSAGVDPSTDTLVVRDESALHAYGNGAALWSLTIGPGTELVGVGGIFAYLREGDAVRVHNVLTGAVAQAYYADGEGTVLVPAHVTRQGAALLYGPDGGYLLATVPEQPTDAPSP